MKLYIIRHSETDWNIERRLQGRANIPLNENGRELARETSIGLSDISFDIIYTSPLIRARETAELIFDKQKESIQEEDKIQEIDFGIYEGYYVSKEKYNVPDEKFIYFFTNTGAYVPPEDGESVEALFDRTAAFLNELYDCYKDTDINIAIVSHGATIRAMLSVIEERPISELWSDGVPQNCAATIVGIKNNKWIVLERDKVYGRKR